MAAADSPSLPSIDAVGRSILAYLVANPGARDTLEGIAEWWLDESISSPGTAEVRRAVDRLVAAELLIERRLADGQRHYALAREQADQIERWLADGRGEGDDG